MEFEEFEEDLRKMTAKEIAEELDRLSKMAGNKVYDERFKYCIFMRIETKKNLLILNIAGILCFREDYCSM